MRLATRLSLLGIVLAVGLLGQVVLYHHIAAAASLDSTPLTRPLAELPRILGEWRGWDQPITDESLLYGEQHLLRTYRRARRQQDVTLWMVYSRTAADRLHYPEICAVAAGKPEEPSGRAAVPVEGHGAPVQQYRFGWPGDYELVYYWHYTLPRAESDVLTPLQRFYLHTRQRRASVTILVVARQVSRDDGNFAREFVQLVDEAIHSQVGSTAVRGSGRIPATATE